MLVKIEARILIFPGTDFHFPSTSVPPGTFLGSVNTPYALLNPQLPESVFTNAEESPVKIVRGRSHRKLK